MCVLTAAKFADGSMECEWCTQFTPTSIVSPGAMMMLLLTALDWVPLPSRREPTLTNTGSFSPFLTCTLPMSPVSKISISLASWIVR